MQELFNQEGDELGNRYEITIDEFKRFFERLPGMHLYIQAAGVWIGKPLLFPLDIVQTHHYFLYRRVTRVTVAEMKNWGPGSYFLTNVNFS